MADAQATYEINLEDGTSKTAESAASALKKLQNSINADTSALRAMQTAMKNLQQGSSVNIDQFRALKAQIDAKKQSIAAAQSSYISLGGSLSGVKKRSKDATDAFAELQKNAQALPGPVGAMASQFQALKGMLAGGAIALGIAAIVVAMVALVAASVAAVGALFKYGLAQGNARRAELLRLEGLTKLRNWYGIAAGNAKEMQTSIDKVSASSALGRDKVGQYSEQLYKAGLRGENLAAALEATAIKASVQGDAAASAFAGWAAGANLAGRSVKALADDVKARLGGIAARQMLDLDVQSAKLHESFSALFNAVDFEPVLVALKGITSLFSQSTYSGQALKAIVTVLFKPMIAAVEFLGPLVKRFFQGIIIGALLVGIGLLKLRAWFRKTFGDTEVLKGIDLTFVALKAGLFVVAAITAGFAALFGIVALMAAPFLALGAGIYAVYFAGKQVFQAFKVIPWKELGSAIVNGIVNGVKNGAKFVIDAVKGLGDSAWSAFRSRLGIASPSKEFARLGVTLPQGVAAGVEAGTPDAQRAVDQMVSVPRMPVGEGAAPASAPGAPSSAQKSTTITIGDIHVNAPSGAPTEMAAEFKRELMRVLEGVAVELGASPA